MGATGHVQPWMVVIVASIFIHISVMTAGAIITTFIFSLDRLRASAAQDRKKPLDALLRWELVFLQGKACAQHLQRSRCGALGLAGRFSCVEQLREQRRRRRVLKQSVRLSPVPIGAWPGKSILHVQLILGLLC